MSGVNKVILIGNLGRDPELTYTPSGMAICKFSLATSDKRKDGTEVIQWHRCTAFERRAEVIAQYFRTGNKIYIEGKLSYGQYEKDGVKHYTTDIIVNSFEFVESKVDAGQQGGGYQPPPAAGAYQSPPAQGRYQQSQQQHGGYQKPPAAGAYQQSQHGGYQPQQPPQTQGGGNGDIPF